MEETLWKCLLGDVLVLVVVMAVVVQAETRRNRDP